MLMTALHILFCVLIFLYSHGFGFFTFCVFMVYLTVGFIDTLGEGMTAIITKLTERVKALEGKEEEDNKDEGKAIGFFFVFRTLIRTVAIWGGGIMSSNKVPIGVIYLIMAVFPVLLFMYTIVIFKEKRVKQKNNIFLETCVVYRMFKIDQ